MENEITNNGTDSLINPDSLAAPIVEPKKPLSLKQDLVQKESKIVTTDGRELLK